MKNRRSASPQPTKEQAEKLRHINQAIKKRNSSRSFFEQYRVHIIVSIIISIVIIAVLSFKKKTNDDLILNPDEMAAHNSNDYPFKVADNSFFVNYTIQDAKGLFNNYFAVQSKIRKCEHQIVEIPEEYNFFNEFPQCRNEIFDQGNCTGGYVITVTSALQNRLCKNGTQVNLSPQSLFSCEGRKNQGCKGGHVSKAMDFAISEGLTDSDCLPFIKMHKYENCSKLNCTRYKAQDYCQVQTKDEIRKDILAHGPVVAMITPYKDFLVYHEGVYQVMEGTARFPGSHVVKIIGWAQRNGYSHWVIENSFGNTWGQGGYGKIAMDGFIDLSEKALSIR